MTMQSTIQTVNRPLCGKADALRLRQFLIDSYAQMGREFNWETRRWEGSYWYTGDENCANPTFDANTHIWETTGGELVGAAVKDGPGDLALQIHPDHRALEDEILAWAEEHFAQTTDEGPRQLVTWAFDWDSERQERLAQRGYTISTAWFWQNRRRAISEPVPDCTPAEGYTIRSVQLTDDDTARWVACTNRVFGHEHPVSWYRNFQHQSPSHDVNLHIIAETSDGTVAAFAGLTVDAANRTATFEPVGTHPDHRRKGLARAVMAECIRRLQAAGTADVIYVANWGTADAGKLYAAMGLVHYATSSAWVKQF